jgi:hypothetical protein
VLEHADGRSGLHEQTLERFQSRLTTCRDENPGAGLVGAGFPTE